jgi:sugar/nucleoside kinase (ribokinase family)
MKRSTEKEFDVIVVGELNVDIIFNQIDSFPQIGKEKLAETVTLTLGSSAAIFASNLSSLGAKVVFIGKVGNDLFGHYCKEQLETKGVDTSLVQVDNKLKTGATAVLNFGEDRANVTCQGAMKYLTVDDIPVEILSGAKHLHFSSYFLQPGFKNNLHILFDKARKLGLTSSLDIQWDPLEKWDFDYKKILPLVDIFLPNESELLNLMGRKDIESAVDLINNYANIVVVKRGNKGSLLVHGENITHCKSFLNGNVEDAIGAGDSFNAGFIFSYLQNKSLSYCQEFANLAGAISTTKHGGTSAFTNYQETMKIAKERFGYEN